ncbi:YtzI protein [Metabacillus sp. FJAT-52054]|uniref:YtzI protein n=1 Tax=Metabacillus sediminis TaxID=3117746 RepID=A0ABZ2NEC1_9BACI
MYLWILGICILIVFVVLALSVVTTNKAYKYEHTIDPMEEEEISPPVNKKDSAEK